MFQYFFLMRHLWSETYMGRIQIQLFMGHPLVNKLNTIPRLDILQLNQNLSMLCKKLNQYLNYSPKIINPKPHINNRVK